jgi:formylglycine-generating enzyme required for sulfatase activity
MHAFIRSLPFCALLLMSPAARADMMADMDLVMRLWCTQAGVWSGDIDITSKDGKVSRSALVSRHDCTDAAAHHIVSERFGGGPSTVKVTIVDRAAGHFHTGYFAGGTEAPYEFDFVSVEQRDDAHWKTVIASKPGTETYEGRPAILRYIRVRDGDTVESWKDVQFADGTADFEPRSKIVQRRVADAPKSPASFRDCPACPEMVALPAGSYSMGSTEQETRKAGLPEEQGARERPARLVTIGRPFAIGRFEVTVDEYAAFARETSRPAVANCMTWDAAASRWGPLASANWRNPGYAQTGSFPVGCVTLEDARAYAAWLATKTGKPYRLPSEAEWEYAARAGTGTMQPWEDDASDICAHANVSDITRIEMHSAAPRDPARYFDCRDGFVYAAPVGSFPADPWGLHDMVGNVWEWTEDCFVPNYEGAPTDGSPRRESNCERLVVRGGSWYGRNWFARPAARSREPADYRSSTLGIRVARDLE